MHVEVKARHRSVLLLQAAQEILELAANGKDGRFRRMGVGHEASSKGRTRAEPDDAVRNGRSFVEGRPLWGTPAGAPRGVASCPYPRASKAGSASGILRPSAPGTPGTPRGRCAGPPGGRSVCARVAQPGA